MGYLACGQSQSGGVSAMLTGRPCLSSLNLRDLQVPGEYDEGQTENPSRMPVQMINVQFIGQR